MNTAAENHIPKLIVLLPESKAGDLELARYIAHYAHRRVDEVLYLVALENPHSSLQVIRSMVTMKAMTSDKRLVVSYQLVLKTDLAGTVKKVGATHDPVVIPQTSTDNSGTFKLNLVRISDGYRFVNALAAFSSPGNVVHR